MAPQTLLLDMPAAAGARLLALSWVEQLALGVPPSVLGNGVDTTRDALWRLRVCLRAYRPELEDAVSKKHRRRVRELAASADAYAALDAQQRWLATTVERLPLRAVPGATWLRERLGERAAAALATFEDRRASIVPALHGQLSKRLTRYTTELQLGAGTVERSFAAAAADALERCAVALRLRFADDVDWREPRVVRRALSALKRTRALLDPLGVHDETTGALVQQLAAHEDTVAALARALDAAAMLHDLAGEAGAAHLRARIDATLRGSDVVRDVTRGEDPRIGLIALAERARDEVAAADGARRAVATDAAVLWMEVDRVAARLFEREL